MAPVELTIGEFSRATGLTVKTLRFYHQRGILSPSSVDPQSGYRYYRLEKIEAARVITQLRSLGFSIDVIAEILRAYDEDANILDFLRSRRTEIDRQVSDLQDAALRIDQIIKSEEENETMPDTFDVVVKDLEPILIAGIRMTGRYSDCGPVFGQVARKIGRYIAGKPMMLHYCDEYREDDADFEVCYPIRKDPGELTDVSVRELGGGPCVSLVHRGPYDTLGTAYARVIEQMKARGHDLILPSREVYLKGPGMIFKGNPKKYLTEIQFMIDR